MMTVESTALAVHHPPASAVSPFSSLEAFESAQRMATALSRSDLVPDQYKGNVANALIALEVANRIGASPLMVMQNLYIVHGRPSWSSSFIIAAINASGRFSPLRFELEGEGDKRGCYVWAFDKSNQERLNGPRVDIAMAKAEGWTTRKGSKWQTMPDLMLRYRAATFFGRMYAPDVLMGMYTAEENHDVAAAKRGARMTASVLPDDDDLTGIDTVTGEVLMPEPYEPPAVPAAEPPTDDTTIP